MNAFYLEGETLFILGEEIYVTGVAPGGWPGAMTPFRERLPPTLVGEFSS